MFSPKNISHLAHKKQLKNADLARVLNLSRTQVGNYMSGSSWPRIDTLIEIAQYFDVNLDDLILKDLSQDSGRPFGAEGEDKDSTDTTTDRMNELLEQRVKQLEEEIKRENPRRAAELGIE